MPYISTTAEYIKTLYIFLAAREIKTTGLQKVFHIGILQNDSCCCFSDS